MTNELKAPSRLCMYASRMDEANDAVYHVTVSKYRQTGDVEYVRGDLYDAARAEAERLRECLEEYAQHSPGCMAVYNELREAEGKPSYRCKCGLDAALKGD